MFRVAYISDTPQFWHYHVTSISFNAFKLDRKNRSNTATISGNSVNINIDCLASNDRLGYNWLPTVII